MSVKTIYNWELYCATEQTYKTVWSPTQPTVCPTNDAHTIVTNPGPKIIQTIMNNNVKIIEEDGVTQAIYKFRGFPDPPYIQNIPSGNVGNVTIETHSWPYPITLLNGWFIATENMVGDSIDATVGENSVIGVITAPVTPGQTVIPVTSTVFNNLYKGFFVSITDGVQTNLLGECVSLNSGNSTITVATPVSNTFSPLSPTYVRLTVKVVENMHILVGNQRYSFAEKKLGGKYIPSNVPIRVKYTNNSGNAKCFSYNMEYMY